MNREGRGQLGFSEVRAWNDNSEIETRTRLAQQSFPYYGEVLTHEQRFRDLTTYRTSLASGPSGSSLFFQYASPCETNDLCTQINPQPNTAYNEASTGYKRVTFSTNVLAATQVTFGNGGKVFIPYVRKKTEEQHPLSGQEPGENPHKRTVTEILASSTSTADAEAGASTNALDVWGNPGATRATFTNGTTGGTAISRDEHVLLTRGTFSAADESNWCLSRLVSSEVTHTKPATNSAGNGHAASSITRTSSFTYGSAPQCVLTSETDVDAGFTKTYGYDTFGNIISERQSGTGIPVDEERKTGAYLSDGTTSSYLTTHGQFPTEVRNAKNHVEVTTWDGRFGVATTITGPNGLTAAAQYDSFGRKVRETPVSALPGVYNESAFIWCANTGMCWDSRAVYTIRATATDGAQGFTEYDRLGRPIHTRKLGFDGNWIASEVYFDPLGREYLASQAYKPATQSTRCWNFRSFDALGRVISTWSSYASTECTSSIMSFAAAPTGGRQSQTTYDLITSEGNTKKIVANSSDTSTFATTRTGYTTENVLGRTRYLRDELSTGGCPTTGASISSNSTGCLQTEYDYDAQGNLTYTKQVGGLGVSNATPSTTIETKAWFDLRGRKTQMSDPDMGVWSYSYSAYDELKTQTDAKGQVTEYGYDKLGRMTSRLEKLNGGAQETLTTFSFDTASMGIGKIASISSSNGFNEWTSYDSLGRAAQIKRQLDGAYYFVDQSYDGQGRPDIMKYPGSVAGDSSSGPEADANRVRVRNNYNGFGYLSSVQDVASGTTYWRADAVDENGGITQKTLGNGRITKRTFDRATGYIGTIRTGSSSNDGEVQNLEFGFDQAANLRLRSDLTAGVNGGNGIREEFSYDKLYRLTQMRQYKPASGGPVVATENYSYDDFGNLLAKGTSYSNYCYVALGGANDPCAGISAALPHAAKRIKLGATSRDYTFDANGNVTSATNAMYDTVTWNVANRPKRVSKGSKYTEFTYGADRARFKQYLFRGATDAETTIYFGALYEKLTKVSGGTTTVEHTHYIAVGGKAVAFAKRTGTGSIWLRYPHRDHLGSIVALTNDSGALVERSAFDPWGKRTSYATWDLLAPGTYTAGGTGTGGLTTGIASIKRGFTNHEHVDELGFVHMNGRVYDSEVGRFFSADPIVQFPLSTQGFNRYAYVGNNPLSYTDPSGFSVNWEAVGQLLNAAGDLVLSYAGGNGYAIAAGWALKAIGGYLQAGGTTRGYLDWLISSALTINIGFGSASKSNSGGSTFNFGTGTGTSPNEDTGGGGGGNQGSGNLLVQGDAGMVRICRSDDGGTKGRCA